jgi:hypothetical protein
VFEPIDGGATPIIVPFSFGFSITPGAAGAPAGEAAAGGSAPAGGAPAGGAAGTAAGAAGFAAAGAFIISMVPLNLGAAAAAFSAKPHLAQAVAVS